MPQIQYTRSKFSSTKPVKIRTFPLLYHWKDNTYSVQSTKQLQPSEIYNNQSIPQRQ